MEPKTIALVVCSADGALAIRENFVEPMIAEGYRVAITLTPTAASWFSPAEHDRLAQLTGLPVRWTARLPQEARPHPFADCFVVAPATANYVAKLATGICDDQATTPVVEALGTGTPIVLFPRVNAAHTRHPAWAAHLDRLRAAGVDVIEGPDVWPLLEPRELTPTAPLPWAAITDAVRRALGA